MTLAEITALLSEVCRKHPDLAQDEKVRRFVLLVVEEGRAGDQLPPIAGVNIRPTDCTGGVREPL